MVLVTDSPGSPLAGALELLPAERFRLEVPPFGRAVYPRGRTVAVLEESLSLPSALPALPEGCPAVLSGQDPAAAAFAGERGLLPLDCGLSLRDTLTLSSLTENSAVVSLQRPVARLDGTLLEPVELPLALTRRWEPYPLLCCAGVLLLSPGAAALPEEGIF